MRNGSHAQAQGRSLLPHPVMCVLTVMALECCICTFGYAQERNYAPRGQAAGALFNKVDSLHQSVKRKLKSALGVKESDAFAKEDLAKPFDAHSQGGISEAVVDSSAMHVQGGTRQRDASQHYPSAMRPGESLGQAGGVQSGIGQSGVGQSGVGQSGAFPPRSQRRGYQPDPRQSNDGRVVAATENGWNRSDGFRPQTAPQNPTRPVEYQDAGYRQNYVRVAEETGHGAMPLSPPVDQGWPTENSGLHSSANPANPVRRWEGDPNSYPAQGYAREQPMDPRNGQNYGSFSGAPAGSNGPLPRGSVLGDSQLTATQHALRLIEENGDLKAKLAMMDAENRRLKDKLAQSESLLGRSTQAVEAAHEEIQALSATNKQLQASLSDSQQKYNRYLLETDRMLQSIREELDDVLVREISAKGN